MLVMHGEVKAHQVDVDFEGFQRLFLVILVGVSRRPLGRGIGGWGYLGRGMHHSNA